VSFIRTFHISFEKNYKWIIIGFIIISTAVFVIVGQPVKILILVGALNGLILPITLGNLLIAVYKKKYRWGLSSSTLDDNLRCYRSRTDDLYGWLYFNQSVAKIIFVV